MAAGFGSYIVLDDPGAGTTWPLPGVGLMDADGCTDADPLGLGVAGPQAASSTALPRSAAR